MITVGSICSGYGGIELALGHASVDHQLAWVSEIDETANAVLAHHWPTVPNIGDITNANPTPVDLITAGFPCQDISHAGQRAGIHGRRSGLWWTIRDVIGDLRPRWVLLENVSAITSGWTDEQTIRCLCGWPHRRRGLPVTEQEPDSIACCWDDEDSEAFVDEAPSRVWRNGSATSSSDRQVGGSMDMADERARMPSASGTHRSVLRNQVRAMQADASIQSASGRQSAVSVVKERAMDRRGADAGTFDPQTHSGTQRQGSRTGNEYRGLCCPSCGGDLGDAPTITTRRPWMGEVLRSLTELGYDCRWGIVRASDAGAPHQRARWFCLAWNSDSEGLERPGFRWSTPERHSVTPDADSVGRQRPRQTRHRRSGSAHYGPYAAAVARWEHITGRPAPPPRDSAGRLNPRFVEWMMGLPLGWVDHGTRRAQIRVLGNGVVPQQAALALRLLAEGLHA